MKRDLHLHLEAPAVPIAENASHWRYALVLLALGVAWLLAWYGGTVKSMTDIYARNDTFAHGYIVPLISVWLAWRKRHELAPLVPRGSWWAIVPVPLAGFAWLLGELASVNALSQFALITLLILTAIIVLGHDVARKLAFPLAFLLFAVPIGEVIMPQLMTWTADFTVAALRLTGVPVYREGQQLVIPTGVWSVVEACSGLRYLIASLMVGTLFAHLIYRSLKRRLMFVALSIVVPIVANWLRAYMIVMLGHLSGNRLAVGVDHLIYGWLFFGVVIGCLFALGARWREDDLPSPVPVAPNRAALSAAPPVNRLWMAILVALALATVWKVGYFAIERSDASPPPRLVSPGIAAPWLPIATDASGWRPHFVEPSTEIERAFRDGERSVGLFISYYRNQDSTSKLVSSENKLVKSDDHVWNRTATGTRAVQINGRSVAVRTSTLRGPVGQELLVWQWYWIDGRVTANDYWAKAYTALARLMGRGDDSAGIVIYTPRERADIAERALGDFVRTAAPAIEEALQKTRDMR
jgi:exosortase A